MYNNITIPTRNKKYVKTIVKSLPNYFYLYI